MNHAGLVCGCQGAGDVRRVSDSALDAQRAALEHHVQRRAIYILHGDEVHAIRLGDLVDGDDVGVIQSRSRPCFVDQTPPAILISERIGG